MIIFRAEYQSVIDIPLEKVYNGVKGSIREILILKEMHFYEI